VKTGSAKLLIHNGLRGNNRRMGLLNISKVAVGCASLDALRRRQEARASGGVVPITTRFKPKRADELIGGSIYWIVKHRITARNRIVGFGECDWPLIPSRGTGRDMASGAGIYWAESGGFPRVCGREAACDPTLQ
jgi:hypothetical protein